MSEEQVNIVNADNQLVRIAGRSEMRSDNLIHQAAYIFVLSPLGSLCVQKRADDKDVYPGLWDLAAGGVVAAGEDYDTTARRELAEELGICNQELDFHGHFFHHDNHCKVWGAVYSCVWEGEIFPQSSEIAEWRFLSLEEIGDFIYRPDITPTTRAAYFHLLQLSGDH